MTHISATMEPVSDSIPVDALREPLPAIFVGERAVAAPAKHGWPGKLIVGLSRLVTAGLGIAACMAIPSGLYRMDLMMFAAGVGVGVWCLVQRRLTKGVRQFTRWGWYGAMMEVGAVTAGKLWALATGSASGVGISLVLDVVWVDRGG